MKSACVGVLSNIEYKKCLCMLKTTAV